MDKQRQLILKSMKDFRPDIKDNEIDEYIPYEKDIQSSGTDESKRFGEMIDIVWKLKSGYTEKSVKDSSFGTYEGDGKKHSEIITPELWKEKNTGRFSDTDSRWLKKTRNPNSETKRKIYWYVDFDSRENLSKLVNELDVNEYYCSADFTENYSKYDVEPDDIIMESTKESIFYQTIFRMIWNGNSLGEIKNAVSTNEMTISKTGIADYKKLVGI
jgi:hypothetical protein